MTGKFLARASAISLALLLTACGGDENSTPLAGSPNNGGGDTTTPLDVVEVGTVELIANPVRLDTSANAQSSITARVKDSNGVLLEEISVDFRVSNGGTLQVSQSETGQAGVATASLTTDGDARNRTVTVTAQSGSVSDTVDVEIAGTSLAISGPSSISLGGNAPLRITLADADGDGLADQPVNLITNMGTLSASTLTTDTNGFVDVQLDSSNASGTATVTASVFSGASTMTASRDIIISGDSFGFKTPTANDEINLGQEEITVEWLVDGSPVPDGTNIQFTATRGTFDPANGLVKTAAGEASISIESNNSGISTVTASDPRDPSDPKDPGSGLSADLSFEFVATDPAEINLQASKTQLDLGETTEIVAVIRDEDNNLVKNQEVTFRILEDGSGGSLSASRDTTDSQGKASTVYNAGSNTSGRDGVEVQAVVGGNISDILTLTVARQALRLAIGTGNEIEEPDTVRYRKAYVAIVTDANGAPVENASIELSVLPTGYVKGSYVENADGDWVISPANATFCNAEDANRNGQLDAGEDTNISRSLEPTNSATTNASSITSAADGSADFELTYPQSHCNWVKVELTATVRVGGSESVESSDFFLSCTASDLTSAEPPGGTEGLYGSAQDCTDEN